MPQLEGTAVATRPRGFSFHIAENFCQRKFQTVKSDGDRKPVSERSPSKAGAPTALGSLSPTHLLGVSLARRHKEDRAMRVGFLPTGWS